jgi:hypothetical protein
MGFLDFLKSKSRGILTSAEPEKGVAPADEQEVRTRLGAISGQGIETAADDGDVVVAWSAKVESAGVDGAEYEFLYRAIRISLDPGKHVATGLCLKTTTDAELDLFSGGLSGGKDWERGQFTGSEKVRVLAWLGPHHTEGGATDAGYSFGWSDLRTPVIAAVTGAGWTYKPKSF